MDREINIGMNLIDGVSIPLKRIGVRLGNVSTKLKTMGTSMMGSNKGISALTKRMLGIGAAIMVVTKAIQAVTEAITNSAHAFRGFEKSMAEVSTIVKEVAQWNDTLTQGVIVLSKQYGKSSQDLASGLYDILSAAVAVEDSLQLLDIAAKAAAAGLTSVEKSVDVLTSVMNAYGKTVEQMYHVSDVLFQSVIRGKFRFEDLASSLGYVTPIAAQVGIQFEEIAAAISSATRQGQHVDMVARGLALSIQNIIKPSQQAQVAAEELGLDLSLAGLRADGLTGFMERLAEVTDGNAGAISKIIPNMRSYRVAMVLAANNAEELAYDTDLMTNSLDATETAFAKVADTVDMSRNILIQYKEEMKRMLGESTTGIEQLGITWEAFTANFVAQWANAMQSTTAPRNKFEAGILNMTNILSLGLGGAISDTMKMQEEATKQAQEYVKAQKKALTEPVKDVVPLWEQALGGEAVDFEQFNRLQNLLTAQVSLFSQVGDALEDAYGRDAPRWAIYELEQEFQDWIEAINETKEGIADFKAMLADGQDAIDYYADSINIVGQRMDDLKLTIRDLSQELQEKEVALPLDYMNHYINLLQEDISYEQELNDLVKSGAEGYAWYTDEIAEAIKVVHDYENETSAAAAAQNEFNEALARNRIETMKIQLLGMMRRRGNTRAEQRMLKKLAIERTELQIEEAQRALDAELNADTEATESGVSAYEEAKDLIDKTIRDQEHLLWKTKDTRLQDMQDLKHSIANKRTMWNNYADDLVELEGNMETAYQVHLKNMIKMFGEESQEVQDLIADYKNLLKYVNKYKGAKYKKNKGKLADPREDPIRAVGQKKVYDAISRSSPQLAKAVFGLNRGTRYVPSTGMYELHRGEAVVGRNNVGSGGDSIVVNVNVTGNTIAAENTDTVARQIADQVQKGLVDRRTGKTKYRMR